MRAMPSEPPVAITRDSGPIATEVRSRPRPIGSINLPVASHNQADPLAIVATVLPSPAKATAMTRSEPQNNLERVSQSTLAQIVARDFFTVEVWTGSGLTRFIVLFFMDLSTRRVQIGGIASSAKRNHYYW